MKILGVSAYFHDSAAALIDDGEIVAAAQEERFTRIKHDAALPVSAIAFCLRQAGITPSDLDQVVFYELPVRKFERILVTQLREFPKSLLTFPRAMVSWLKSRLWVGAELSAAIGCDPAAIVFGDHHLSHAASAFLCSPFERAAVVTVDGVGEWATTSIYRAETTPEGSSIDLIQELHFPHSIGLLYSALTAYLGFEVNEGEYKVMGLAAYGQPRFLPELERICSTGEDGSLAIDPRYFAYPWHPTRSFTPELERLLGPAREPESPLSLPAAPSSEDQRFADVAASIQRFTERYLLSLVREAHRLTGESCLALAGGVALNSVANRRILDEGPFRSVFVQPAAGDAGGALGAALWACHVGAKRPRKAPLKSAFLGEAYSPGEIERFLGDCRVPYRAFSDRGELHEEVARLLATGEVGGWLQGRFEWGPRALGARSILADPREASMRDRVNRKIKFREPFRPFAPAVLEDEIERWFVPAKAPGDHTTSFMCSVAPVTDEARAKIPAVVHVDGTARLERVERETNPLFSDLLERWRARTGVGVLLNTSLNLKGEPICASPAEAYGAFVRSDLDFLVLEHCLIERRNGS